MDFKAFAGTIAKYTPLLASAIDEFNPIAGKIVLAIYTAFESPDKPILEAIDSDPKAQEKLKQIEIEHYDALLRNQTEDKANARDREEKIIALTGKRDGILDFIAILVIVGFFILCMLNYFINLSDDHIVVMLIGQISSGFLLVLGYYFGSSNK